MTKAKKPSRRRIAEQIERIHDGEEIQSAYSETRHKRPKKPALTRIATANEDYELGAYFESFLADMKTIPLMPKLDLMSPESAGDALKVIEERLHALQQRERTAAALHKLLRGQATEE